MRQRENTTVADLGLLGLRLTIGGLMAGHGAQKLFGLFGGFGLAGVAGWLESLGMKPGRFWALLAGGSEMGSGALIAAGFLNPLGPIGLFGPMLIAWNKGHAGKPIWAQSGGAELPLVYMVAAGTLGLTGPGRYSLDEALAIEVPMPLIVLTATGVAVGVAIGIMAQPDPAVQQEDQARDQLQAGADAAQGDDEAGEAGAH